MPNVYSMAKFFAKNALAFKSFAALLCDANVPPQEREQFITMLKSCIQEMMVIVETLESAQNKKEDGQINGTRNGVVGSISNL